MGFDELDLHGTVDDSVVSRGFSLISTSEETEFVIVGVPCESFLYPDTSLTLPLP
jgi:hypothetical protein